MPIFVTGGTGFIGQHLIRFFLKRMDPSRHKEIFCFVRQASKLPEDIAVRVTVCVGDASRLEDYAAQIQKCEIIYHVAANAVLGNKSDYEQSNVQFTANLIAIAEKSNTLKRFVFTSTIGAVDRMSSDACERPLDENSLPNPLSDYGKSKLFCEQKLAASKIPYVIVRPAWVYGPEMRENSHVRFLIEGVHSGKLFTQFDFPGKVSLIHVEDLVKALVLVAEHSESMRNIYFVADDEPVSLGQLFQTLGKILGRPAGRIQIGFGIPSLFRWLRPLLPLAAQNLFSHVLWASPEKLKSLGFQPAHQSSDGLLELAHWHFRTKNKKAGKQKKWAVVTGGAGGIGKALCEQLFAKGYRIVSVDRNPQPAKFLSDSWENWEYDLSDEQKIRSLIQKMSEEVRDVDVWINNAGFGMRGKFLELDGDGQKKMLITNCAAYIMLGHFILKKFVAQKRGVLVNMASSASFQPLPYMAAYAASKTFVLHWSEALSAESDIQTAGVKIVTVCPSGTATEFQKKAGVKGEKGLLPASWVAAKIIRSLDGASRTLILGPGATMMLLAAKIIPRNLQPRLWEHLMARMR